MRAMSKVSLLAIVLLLAGGLLGGCPTVIDDNPADDSAANNSGNQTNNNGANNNTNNNSNNNTGQNTNTNTNNNNNNTDGSNTNSGNSGSNDTGNNGGNTDNGDTPDETLVGSFTGILACTKTEAINDGALGIPKTWNENFAFEIDTDGIPTQYTIPGYMQAEGGIRFDADVFQVGDSVTLNETRGTYAVTLKITVALANYAANGGRVVLQLEHDGVKGALTEVGTGMCVIEFTADGDNLAYSSVTDYTVKLSGIIDTRWHVECEGTLTPQ